MKKKFVIIFSLLISLPFFTHGQTLDDELQIIIDGRTRVVVTDPSGLRTGSHGFDVWQENEQSALRLHSDSQSITYTGIPLGTYTLDFHGQHDEQFTTTFSVIDNGRYYQIEFTRWADKQTHALMTITLSRNEEGSLRIDSPELTRPYGSSYKLDNAFAELSWEEVAGATQYTIYSKFYDYPYFAPIGETTTTRFTTNVPWATDSGNALYPNGKYFFTVIAHFENGNTTAMSPYISNDDQDGDGLNDWREADLRTNPINADTDADGLDDYLEINHYYTSPTSSDSDGDGFADGDEVEQGTLPNHGESYPGKKAECDAPTEGDWHVTADCDVARNQSVAENIVVHPHALMRIRKHITVLFDYLHHSIVVMFGGGIKLDEGAEIQQK